MYFKQIDEIVNGTKTVTRRICKPGEDYRIMPVEGDILVPDGNGDLWVKGYVWKNRPISSVYTAAGRLKWQVGRDYAVSPGRGKPGVYVNFNHPCYGYDIWRGYEPVPTDKGLIDWREFAPRQGYEPLRIVITAIRREPLQAITEADAIAEGWPEDEDVRECPHCDALYPTGWYDGPNLPCTCNPITWYRELWERINGAGSWEANPDVWVVTFEKKEG